MIGIKHERSGFSDSLERLAGNLEDIAGAHDEALDVIEAQNADINFDLDHRHTVVTKSKDRIAVGTTSKTYAPLLTMDGEEVADVYRRRATQENT